MVVRSVVSGMLELLAQFELLVVKACHGGSLKKRNTPIIGPSRNGLQASRRSGFAFQTP